jgi:hypothetical protein
VPLRSLLLAVISALSIGGGLLFLDAARPPLPDDLTVDCIVVEKTAHRLSLVKDGQPLRAYRVALGRREMAPKQREDDARPQKGATPLIAASRTVVAIWRCISAIPVVSLGWRDIAGTVICFCARSIE